MTTATYTNPMAPPPVTGRAFGKLGLVLGGLLLLGFLLVAALLYWQSQSQAATPVAEKAVKPWKNQSVYPPAQEEPTPLAPPSPSMPDPQAARLDRIERSQQQLMTALEALRQRPQTPPPIPPPVQVVKPKTYLPPLHLTNKVEGEAPPTVPEYTLAPGATKLPCLVETAINSDVEGYFTAKVTTNVYDTATGRHLLVPQGSTILGNDNSSQLVYGNERLNTVSLTLTLPDGRDVDLGRAPITDAQGVAGLTGDVNGHFGRLLAAVLIQGVLKGGVTAVTVAANNAAGAGQVASGIAGVGAQTGTQITGPLLSTRPTIKVSAGEGCLVLLLKPLHLPALWQDGQPKETYVSTTKAPTTATKPTAVAPPPSTPRR